MVLAYDGSAYAGWQKQENALGIQEVVEKALSKIQKEPVSIVASGRTDAGVHALGQVIHFTGRAGIPLEGYYKALNAMLPPDIRVRSVEEAPEGFHARFSARRKVYRYIASTEPDNPFSWRYKAFLYRRPDIAKMKEAAAHLIGTHDFTSYSNGRIDPRKSRIKTIESIEIEERGNDIVFTFAGNGFLRYQVRMMTGTLLEVGAGRLAPEDVRTILEARDKEACRFNADACGLYLVEVNY